MIKVAVVIYFAAVGWITHTAVTMDETSTDVAAIAQPVIFDPRPYLPAPTTTSTTVVVESMSVRYVDRCPEWRGLVESYGVTKEQLPFVMRIIYRESRCNADAINDTKNRDGSIDYGLAQINDKTWCLPTRYSSRGWLQERRIVQTCRDLLDAETNVRALVALMAYSSDRTGCPFTPWLLCDDWNARD